MKNTLYSTKTLVNPSRGGANHYKYGRREFLRVITSGISEIEKDLGGGIPKDFITLMECEADSKLSILTQQPVRRCLNNGFPVIVFATKYGKELHTPDE